MTAEGLESQGGEAEQEDWPDEEATEDDPGHGEDDWANDGDEDHEEPPAKKVRA